MHIRMKHRISQVDGNNDSEEENSDYSKDVKGHIPASSGLIIVRNWDKEPGEKPRHFNEVLLKPPTQVFCHERGIGTYQTTCTLDYSFTSLKGRMNKEMNMNADIKEKTFSNNLHDQ